MIASSEGDGKINGNMLGTRVEDIQEAASP
jgi:hypothetical protein